MYKKLFTTSDAIERLLQTANLKALLYHLEHNSTLMTMRYPSTLMVEDALRMQQDVKF